jgi:hypothetical protein
LNKKKQNYFFITYAVLSTTFILIVSWGILSSLPTVQERAYRKWFNGVEPRLWTSQEDENPLSLPSISITTPTTRYICAPKESGCSISVNQEQILRYLRLIEVSKAMRSTKAPGHLLASGSSIEIRIHEGNKNRPIACQLLSKSATSTQESFGEPLFTGIMVENKSGIALQVLLSLVEHSCVKLTN